MAAEPLEVRIIPAREESLARINDLIVRSKSYSNWPADYLKKPLPLHEIEPSYPRRNQCFELLDVNDQLDAFLTVAVSDTRVVLDNLWVRPDLIGKGVGRRACEHAFQLAREYGWRDLWVIPDPPAEGFYKKASVPLPVWRLWEKSNDTQPSSGVTVTYSLSTAPRVSWSTIIPSKNRPTPL